jgi:hypothetical protein
MGHRRSRIRCFVVALLACPLLAAGCGGGRPAGVASVSSSTTTASYGAVAYARCMRARGVSDFPDPDGNGRFAGNQLKSIRVGRSLLRTADRACEHLLPSGLGGLLTAPQDTARQARIQLADELSFARCMRSHGVTRFPDPSAHGELSVQMVRAQGIDVHSAAVLHVVADCLPASHGWLTPARVRAALSGAGG